MLHVLIVHYNTPELTGRLVRDFPRKTPHGRPVSIRILDNSSTPQNLETLRANIEGLQHVMLEVRDENIGFGEGMNQLARSNDIEESDILWLLNSDTRLSEGCLKLLEDELAAGEFAVISPLIYCGDGADSRIWYCGGTVSPRELRVELQLFGRPLSAAPHSSFETEFAAGTAPMMCASTFRAIGGFPRDYFLYWEDVYLSWKARSLGFRLGVVPSAHLWHAVGASSGPGSTSTFYYWAARNRFTYARHVGIPRHRLIVGRGGVESLRPVAKALFMEQEGRLSKTGAAIRGTLRGLR